MPIGLINCFDLYVIIIVCGKAIHKKCQFTKHENQKKYYNYNKNDNEDKYNPNEYDKNEKQIFNDKREKYEHNLNGNLENEIFISLLLSTTTRRNIILMKITRGEKT